MTQKLLYAHVLIDRSGSMKSCRDSTIDAFNEYVSSLANDPDVDAAVSLSLFDSGHAQALRLKLVFDGKKAADMPKLTRETFVPAGGTPLNDAIGKTVERIDGEWHRPGEGIALVILTDGQENASKEFTKDAIKKLLDGRQKDKNWLVIYLGANQDAFAEGAVRGMSAANTMGYSVQNVGATMKAAARSTAMYAATGSATLAQFTDEERKKAAGH